MATRRVILCIGDETVTGRPVSELTAIDPTFDDVQTKFAVWNVQAQQWQSLTPGVNSNSTLDASDLWSYESRLRAGLESAFPEDTLYLIKHASAGSLRDWSPDGGSLLTAVLAEIQTAALDIKGESGDEISIDAIVICIQKEDHRLDTWRSYGSMLKDLIEGLRARIALVEYAGVGTLRDDGGPTPVVVIAPQYSYSPQDERLVHCRMQAEILENEDNRVRVVRTHGLASSTAGLFTSAAAITLSEMVASHIFPASYDDADNPEGKMVLIIGDEAVEGSFTSAANLPAHQQETLTGVNIWKPVAGVFEELKAGSSGNNLISWPQVTNYYGLEIALGDHLRRSFDPYIVKGSQITSFGSDARAALSTEDATPPPHGDLALCSWGPGRGQLADLCARGWFKSAAMQLRTSGMTPALKLVVISAGITDAVHVAGDPRGVRPSVEAMIGQIKKHCSDLSIVSTDTRFVVLVPPSYAIGVDTADLEIIRNDLLALSDVHDDVTTVDLSGYESSNSYNLNDTGTAALAQAVYDAYRTNQPMNVRPMFVPTMLHLRRSLRLSGVNEDNDAMAMIDSADQMAKARFFRTLGQTKIEDLQAIAYTTHPVTSNDHLRNLAVETEIKMVRLELMRTLPLMFKDGSQALQSWNDEGAFREGGYLQTEKEISRLNAEIDANLDILLSRQIVGASSFNVEAFPSTENDLPGDTTFKVI